MSIEADYIRKKGISLWDNNVVYINDVGHIAASAYDECVLLGKIYNKIALADKALTAMRGETQDKGE